MRRLMTVAVAGLLLAGCGSAGVSDGPPAKAMVATTVPVTTTTVPATTTTVRVATTVKKASSQVSNDAALYGAWSVWLPAFQQALNRVVAAADRGDLLGATSACVDALAMAGVAPSPEFSDGALNSHAKAFLGAATDSLIACIAYDPAEMNAKADLAARKLTAMTARLNELAGK